ncbi:unnamed protein product [Spodoptera littoralis]|uniref:Trans-1,2-dihydrobenzene-1,2-diol dehydrogenase n=1 Tax=Spodoptera littoralis TaxID=7109 RepID=A0A9P0I2E4_SPOLI|nr:unnamed protein product [Spodoptera littoralis]CAH1639837.1 unnamed protein product [Spodoptera littoralis]
MTLRWGIVTAGKISNDFVNAFNSYPEKGDQEIVAVAARNKDRAEEFAKLHSIAKVFDSYQALANSSDIDVVYIGALNNDHYGLCKMFLENGKHVLCEKPFCLNAKQTQSVINLARNKNLFIMEAVWTRFSPAYIDVGKRLRPVLLVKLDLSRIEDPFHFPDKVTHVDGSLRTYPLHTSKLPYVYGNSAGLVYQALEVARCIRAGLIESPRMSHKESLVLAKLMDTVRSQLGVHYDADDEEYP